MRRSKQYTFDITVVQWTTTTSIGFNRCSRFLGASMVDLGKDGSGRIKWAVATKYRKVILNEGDYLARTPIGDYLVYAQTEFENANLLPNEVLDGLMDPELVNIPAYFPEEERFTIRQRGVNHG